MTPEQYERWKDFSFRMVNVTLGPRKRSPSRKTLRENIEFFFECRMDPDDAWKKVIDWDHNERDSDDYCVSDHIKDLSEHFIPNYWSLPYPDENATAYDKAVERWVDPISICVRSGLDVAVSPSAGVLGYTVGDLRKMYPEGVPDCVKEFFKDGERFDEFQDAESVWL